MQDVEVGGDIEPQHTSPRSQKTTLSMLLTLWGSYKKQRDAFQKALDRYWWLDERPGSPLELAGIGPWYGPIKSIIEAPVVITEDDLEYATHPTVASYEPEPGSIAWMERTQDFGYLLQNQFQPSDHAQPTGPGHHRIRLSAAPSMSFQVESQRTCSTQKCLFFQHPCVYGR